MRTQVYNHISRECFSDMDHYEKMKIALAMGVESEFEFPEIARDIASHVAKSIYQQFPYAGVVNESWELRRRWLERMYIRADTHPHYLIYVAINERTHQFDDIGGG